MKRAPRAHRYFMAGLALAAFSAGADAQTIWTANPVADAFVTTGPTNNLPGNNYGAAGADGISGTSASRSGVGFQGVFDTAIRFDLAAAKSSFDAAYGAGLWTVQTITLRLTTTSATNAIFNSNSSGEFSIVWMENDGWTEGTGTPMAPTTDGITYTSLPDFLGANDQNMGTFLFDTATSGTDGSNTTFTLTFGSGLVTDVMNGGLASFELLAVSDSASYLFNSGNFTTASRRPVLSITAVAVPEPSTFFLFGVGGLVIAAAIRLKAAHEAS